MKQKEFSFVSIHAPRVGRDGYTGEAGWQYGSFNPRAPRGARQLNSNSFGFYVLAR